MTLDITRVRIFIRPGYTDLRKAVNGLSPLIEQEMEGEPFSGNVYLFCNRERNLLKGLWWDRNGFWLSRKRRTCGSLEKDKYPWPENGGAARELSGEEWGMLLRGIDFFKAHKEIYYKRIS
jgi:transposase